MKFSLLICAVSLSTHLFAITTPKPIDPVVFSLKISKDQAWQKVMDLFVANSIPIKLMDKSSGLIQSDKIGLGSHYALSNADDSVSWALCEAVKSAESVSYTVEKPFSTTTVQTQGESGTFFYHFPQIINAELQVYVRETDDGTVLLSINLMNLSASAVDANTGNTRDFAIKTSKRLENTIGNFLNSSEKMPTLNFDPPFATFGEPPSQAKKRAMVYEMTKKLAEKDDQAKSIGGALLIVGLIGLLIAVGINSEGQ
jgi:hypothetical protein